MRIKLKLADVYPYDGEYEIDLSRLTNRDYHDIKRVAGYTPPELVVAVDRGDTDIIVALAVIALRKTGQYAKIDEDVLWDAVTDGWDVDAVADEGSGVADPPTTLPEPGTPSTPSGGHSPTVGANPEARILRPTGTDSSAS